MKLLALSLVAGFSVALAAQSNHKVITSGRSPSLSRFGDHSLALAYEGTEPGANIFVRTSEDAESWPVEVNASLTPGISTDPHIIAEADGTLDLVWLDTTSGSERPDIFFARSGDGGKSWTKAVDVSNTPGVSKSPCISLGPKNSLYVAWIDDSEDRARPDVYYAYSYNHGASWTKPRNLSRTPGVSSEPTIACDQNYLIHVAWLDSSSGSERPDVYYLQGSEDQWSQPRNVSNTAGVSRSPAIAVNDKNRIFLTWADTTRTKSIWDIYFASSEDGQSFSKPVYFSTPGNSLRPRVACQGSDRVGVVWQDDSDNAQFPDIFAILSQDGGSTFSKPLNVSRSPDLCQKPQLVMDSEAMQIVWEEIDAQKSPTIRQSKWAYPKKPRPPMSGGKH